MLSKSIISLVRSLQQKKMREQEGLFIAEGRKVVGELLNSRSVASGDAKARVSELMELRMLIGTNDALNHFSSASLPQTCKVLEASHRDMERISALTTAQDILAVSVIPDPTFDVTALYNGWTFLLDDIRDPGNMGTILRIAHWFGVGQVVSSLNSVDYFNPKVVQAAMGSLFHVPVYSMGLEGLLSQLDTKKCPDIIAAVLDGEDLFHMEKISKGILLLGNESTGLRSALRGFSTRNVTIPSFETVPGNRPESLNVAVSAALLISSFRAK
ncbi:MAG: TrmH family RNA methyltransferase [Bacteroidota bacterium]